MRDYSKRLDFIGLPTIFIISLMCAGIFHEYFSCAFSVFFLILLLVKVKQNKQFAWRWNCTSIMLVILIGMYGVSVIWAVDSGMALMGVFKFLPVLLFFAILMQEQESAEIIESMLPYVAGILAILSVIAMYIPALSTYFSVAGRLAGFFQYPNTFALFLLVAELLMLGKNHYKLYDYAVILVLISGLLLTGSRTVFVLAIVSNIMILVFHKNKKIKGIGLAGVVLVIVGIIVYVLAFEGASIIGRFLRFSLTESTFVGRILYFADALPVILRTPFGLGYMGYYYIQQSIQTGLYSVRYVHNDFLQILLDVGWIPCVLFVIAIIRTFLNKKVTITHKIILGVLVLHSCFDFNLQFVAMFFLVILFMDWQDGRKITIYKNLSVIRCSAVSLMVLSTYIGASLVLFQTGKYELSLKLYPWNTQAQTMILTEIEDMEQADAIADSILGRNAYVTLAYSIKSRSAYSKGDFGNVIAYKNMLIEKAPFQYAEYEEYCDMLLNGISLYTKAGDIESANVCRQELLAIPDKLEQAKQRISGLGKQIKDQPTTVLPEDIVTYIDRLESAN